MAREISRAESWERAHEVFSQINFNSFDFNTIKESLLDYMKLYFPEDFNDYIESSEFVAILELFAYAAELLAYRVDLNAHENFITTAQRKESVLRLAKLLSYKVSRNIPARGLVKLASIQTTETVIDSNGRNLAGRSIVWNDSNNPDWKEQFILVMNRALEQDFGTVSPNERIQIEDVLFELYTWNNSPNPATPGSIISYSANAINGSVSMELTPVQLTPIGPTEKRPERNAKMSLLFGSDGLGDSSDTTGFFLYTKQGEMRLEETFFDGVTPNLTFNIDTPNINDTDLWVNLVESDNRQIVIDDPFARLLPHLVAENIRFGEWVEVDLANAQNILFNTNKNRHKYEIETLDEDKVQLVFGDGEFSDIPSGPFDIWYRVSENEEVVVPKNAVISKAGAITYLDDTNNIQTLSFTFSLVNTLQNNSPSEDLEHIRRVASSVYYTQDRMVNGRDYNTFMLQDPSILKMRAINRTFAGDSKYIAWHDPRESYEDVKLFGDDMALYWDEQDPNNGGLVVINTAINSASLLSNFVEPLLCSTDFFAKIGPILESRGSKSSDLRCEFNNKPYSFDPNDNELNAILLAINAAQTTTPIVDLYYSVIYDEWTVGVGSVGHTCDIETSPPPHTPPNITGCISGPAESIWMIRIEARFAGSVLSGWDVKWRTRRLINQSTNIRFWHNNTTNRIINFDTLNSNLDTVVVLAANTNADGTGILGENRKFGVLGQELIEQNLPDAGLPDIHRLSILPVDINNDGVPDNLLQPILFDATVTKKYQDYIDDSLVSTDAVGVIGIAEITSIQTVADVADSLNGQYFFIHSPTTTFYVWYTNGSGVDPAPGGTAIPVVFNTNDTANIIASLTQTAINGNSAFDAVVSTNIVTVTNTAIGSAIDGIDFDTTFIISTSTQGAYAQTIIFPNNRKVIVTDNIDIEFELRLNGALLTFSNNQLLTALSSESDILSDRITIDKQLAANINNALVPTDDIEITFIDYVYFKRDSAVAEWVPQLPTDEIKTLWALDTEKIGDEQRYKRHSGRYPLNFAWFHSTPRFHLIDPTASNLIDMFIITQGYHTSLKRWLENKSTVPATAPTPLELRTSYADLISNAMISDTIILHSGIFKILFGPRSSPELRSVFKVIRPVSSTLTDNEVKVRIVETTRSFFQLDDWEFGENFFFTELAASIHAALGPEIDSVVLVPTSAQNQFGDMFQVQARENEMFIPDINTSDIEIVQSYTSVNIRQ